MNKLSIIKDGEDSIINFTNQFGSFSWSPSELQDEMELAKFRRLIDFPNGRIEVIGISKAPIEWDSYQKTLYIDTKTSANVLHGIRVAIYSGNPYLTTEIESVFRYLLPFGEGALISKIGDNELIISYKAINQNIRCQGRNFTF
jgi:hypothetical protein